MQEIQILQTNLEHVITLLAPKFSIPLTKLGWYSAIIDNTKPNQYSFENRTFSISPEMINNINILGEEVSHYLHSEINPMWQERCNWKKYWERAIILECVAHYGAVILSRDKGLPFQKTKQIEADSRMESHSWENELTHWLGYKRGEELFLRYGDLMLSQVARMSITESTYQLPRIAPISFYENKILPIIDKFKS